MRSLCRVTAGRTEMGARCVHGSSTRSSRDASSLCRWPPFASGRITRASRLRLVHFHDVRHRAGAASNHRRAVRAARAEAARRQARLAALAAAQAIEAAPLDLLARAAAELRRHRLAHQVAAREAVQRAAAGAPAEVQGRSRRGAGEVERRGLEARSRARSGRGRGGPEACKAAHRVQSALSRQASHDWASQPGRSQRVKTSPSAWCGA